jgi:putative transposase
MDHTKMDVIVVDEAVRQPIGRPSLTLAIDIFTRCIVGMLVTLEAPSATSVGLCLAHVVTDKGAWLERLGLEIGLWPMHGKPRKIHLDNAPEFHSEALKRGCEQHGIERDYRPKKQPHFGGIIERVIGTAMTMVHELPGTTFSNPQERGTYKSEARASLTVAELEKWLVLAIGTYHNSIHSSLLETPAAVWARSTQSSEIAQLADKKAFLVDFLPVVRRRITRVGFVIDHISYYADSLKPWIARRDRLEKFIIRCDPRDLSRIWVLAPESNLYFEIPYRSISHPAVTRCESLLTKQQMILSVRGGIRVVEVI